MFDVIGYIVSFLWWGCEHALTITLMNPNVSSFETLYIQISHFYDSHQITISTLNENNAKTGIPRL